MRYVELVEFCARHYDTSLLERLVIESESSVKAWRNDLWKRRIQYRSTEHTFMIRRAEQRLVEVQDEHRALKAALHIKGQTR